MLPVIAQYTNNNMMKGVMANAVMPKTSSYQYIKVTAADIKHIYGPGATSQADNSI